MLLMFLQRATPFEKHRHHEEVLWALPREIRNRRQQKEQGWRRSGNSREASRGQRVRSIREAELR